MSLKWRQVCDKEPVEILFNLFFSEDPAHVHIATINIDDQPYPEKIFTVSSRSWNESSALNKEQASAYSSFYDYLELGVKHILTGLDHIAFLVGLLLLKLKRKNLIIVITGFTIGHSITLALGALNYITPASLFVEALIGYSIVIVAIECVACQNWCTGKVGTTGLSYAGWTQWAAAAEMPPHLSCMISTSAAGRWQQEIPYSYGVFQLYFGWCVYLVRRRITEMHGLQEYDWEAILQTLPISDIGEFMSPVGETCLLYTSPSPRD